MENLGENLLRYTLNTKNLILTDTETEGLNYFFDRPWQVGWLECKGKDIVKIHNHYLWWPDLHISSGAAAVTHFNYQDYKSKAEDPKVVYEKFHPYIFDPNVISIGHNFLGIDAYMINSWRRSIGLPVDWSFLNNNTIDTHSVAKAIKKGIKITNPRLEWMYKLNNLVEKGLKTNLGLLAREYGIELDDKLQHSADYDIILNWEIFKKQIWDIEI